MPAAAVGRGQHLPRDIAHGQDVRAAQFIDARAASPAAAMAAARATSDIDRLHLGIGAGTNRIGPKPVIEAMRL